MTKAKPRPFMGVDGEGGGRNRRGQQHYLLLRAGPYELFRDNTPLTPFDCLDFICELPAKPLLVGFAFGYDTTQILRDLPPDRIAKLFEPKDANAGHSRYTWVTLPDPDGSVARFGVEYLPKNYLRVCRMASNWRAVPNSARTIYEVFGNFQMSFVKALQAFDIGAEHWDMLLRNKEARSDFRRMTREIRHYNELECFLLSQLMEEFRATCHAVDIRPPTWNGAGKLAAAEHTRNKTITSVQVALRTDADVLRMASDAYYGGRFEVSYVGDVPGPIHEYDLNSAYPAIMRSLPCMLHGTWYPFSGRPPPGSLHVAYVTFSHKPDAKLCGLPIRQHDGRLFWPREGQGVYWSTELNSARRLGTTIRYTAGWAYRRCCDCQPYDWVEHRYRQRLALGSDAKGYPLKLALNSLYGKLAQRIGNPRFGNLVHAGLITAGTRALLNDAARQSPADIVMFATDALFSRVPLRLRLGTKLGQWKPEPIRDRLFVVQPGLYWGAKRPKTRGVPSSLFDKHTPAFERAWGDWCRLLPNGPESAPSVKIPVPSFVGLRLAHARGKPGTAGIWTKETDAAALRAFSFDWTGKRSGMHWETPLCVRTDSAPGAPDLVSERYDGQPISPFDLDRMILEDTADPSDLSPP